MKGKSSRPKLAPLLIADRLAHSGAILKKPVQRNSVTEYTGIAKLSEQLSVLSRSSSLSAKFSQEDKLIEERYSQLLEGLRYDLSIPPRVPYTDVEPGEYKAVERVAFCRWKSFQRVGIFERNIEVWRQFWLACERCDVIAQIVDSRAPDQYFAQDILTIYPEKQHVILCNKADLVPVSDRAPVSFPVPVLYYSAKEGTFECRFWGKVALVGYPNVGKSSTINMILSKKKVKVSSTPGKTRSIQTIETPDFTLIDCPGLVFPRHEKISLVLMGVLNIDHVPDLTKYADQIINEIGAENIYRAYNMRRMSGDVLEDYSEERGWTKSKCLKKITKDFVSGNITKYSH